ncbi:hypothetical protein C7974DRAFT_416164 [Boeremia exigua]|uniref:uncharacterized protein n=1 Tax=Boeremia exigua TaxID=749465 RepID=UPI001E8E2D7C|nr:uncharacterized protein C7974DRAFT_416164 [Boeremia exigua]KAH6618818.1 hypothetical protein C7974DRAFT_416164 [Boeremia exigua]
MDNSNFVTPYQLEFNMHTMQHPQEYDVWHHQNIGDGQLLSKKIGTFLTIPDAQYAAKDALWSVLDHYVRGGWTGFYHDTINLELRGLVTGMVGPGQYEALSEIQIHARPLVYAPLRSHPDVGHASNARPHHNTQSAITPHAAPHTYTPKIVPDVNLNTTPPHPHSFSQTRPPYPNRPLTFIPRLSGIYDDVITLSPHRPTTERVAAVKSQKRTRSTRQHKSQRTSHTPQAPAAAPTGPSHVDPGNFPYLGRRHSASDHHERIVADTDQGGDSSQRHFQTGNKFSRSEN